MFGRFLRFGIAPGMLPSPQRVPHSMLPSPPHSNSNSASTASISGAHAGLNGAASGASGTTPAACRDQSLPTSLQHQHRHHHQQQQHHHQRLAEVRQARQGALIASLIATPRLPPSSGARGTAGSRDARGLDTTPGGRAPCRAIGGRGGDDASEIKRGDRAAGRGAALCSPQRVRATNGSLMASPMTS